MIALKEKLVRLEQPLKALFPMLVTLLGIAYVPIFPPGYCIRIVLSLLNNTPFIEEKLGLSDTTSIAVKPEQKPKAELPMLVTLLGISTEVKPVQPEKA